MLKSEEDLYLHIITRALVFSLKKEEIGPVDSSESIAWVRRLIEERDALRSVIVRQETALTQQARGGDAGIQD